MPVPLPDFDTLGNFANAATQNARRLLADAELLLQRGRWPTAHSLAVLALEEAGKAWLCVIALFVPDNARPEFPFGDLDLDHLWKLGAAHGMEDMLAFIRGGEGAPASVLRAVDELQEIARADNQAKQRGLYADCRDEVVWNPSQMPKDEAARMVAAVRDVLYHGGPLLAPGFITWIAHLPDDIGPMRDEFWNRLMVAFAQGGARALGPVIEAEFAGLDGLAEMLDQDARLLAKGSGTGPVGARGAVSTRRQPTRRKRRPRRRR